MNSNTFFFWLLVASVALGNSQGVGQSDRTNVPLADPMFQKVTRGPVHDNIEQDIPTFSPLFHVTDIDSFIRNHMQANMIPGLAACVVKGGRIAWEGYYGLANISRQDSVRQNTIFMLASISKTVMATALMQLWENGRFGLDDSINAYLPFPVHNPSFTGVPITFRQLLCHVSSINDTWSLMPYFIGDPPLALGWYLQEYLTPSGSYFSTTNYAGNPPATQWTYCNIAAALAGYLVETITGIPFDRYCRDSIFVPLGMSNTAWFLRDLDTTLIARPYTWNGSYQDNGLYGFPDYPDGQLRTTARSLARFMAAYIGFGVVDGIRILDSTTVQLMRSIQYPTLNPSQGLIWYRSVVGSGTRWGHTGGEIGVRTFMYLDETQRYGVIVLTNFSPASSIPVAAALLAMAETLTVNVGWEVAQDKAPCSFRLQQNYPNPFNPSTTISYQLPAVSLVVLNVFDPLGREVAKLVDAVEAPGFKSVTFDGNKLASGVYLYQLRAGAFVSTKKLLLLR